MRRSKFTEDIVLENINQLILDCQDRTEFYKKANKWIQISKIIGCNDKVKEAMLQGMPSKNKRGIDADTMLCNTSWEGSTQDMRAQLGLSRLKSDKKRKCLRCDRVFISEQGVNRTCFKCHYILSMQTSDIAEAYHG